MKFIKIYFERCESVLIFNLDQLEFLGFHEAGDGQNYAEIKFKNKNEVISLALGHEQTKMFLKHTGFENPSDYFLHFLRNEDVCFELISQE